MLQTQLPKSALGSQIEVRAPEETSMFPPGEYLARVYCVCDYMVTLEDFQRLDGQPLPADFRVGGLRVEVSQPNAPGPGVDPNCPVRHELVGECAHAAKRLTRLHIDNPPALRTPKDSKGNPIDTSGYNFVRRR